MNRTQSRLRLLHTAIFAAAAACAVICGSTAEASIVGGGIVGGHGLNGPSLGLDSFASSAQLARSVDQILGISEDDSTVIAEQGAGQSSSGTTGSAPTLSDPWTPLPEDDRSPAFGEALPSPGSSGGSTSAPSSAGPGPSGGPGLLAACAAEILSLSSLTERYLSEQALLLPAPPGTELLRPPAPLS